MTFCARSWRPGDRDYTLLHSESGLAEEGNKFLEAFTQDNFETGMKFGEASMSYYLETGKKLKRM